MGDERYGAQVVAIVRRHPSLPVALVAVLAIASPARADVAPVSVAQTQRLENQGCATSSSSTSPTLSSSERADLRADADVTHLRNLVLRDAELVRTRTGELVEAVRELRADPDVLRRARPARAGGNRGPILVAVMGAGRHRADRQRRDRNGRRRRHASGAWAQSTGTGQTVAVVDTGVESAAPDLEGQFAADSGGDRHRQSGRRRGQRRRRRRRRRSHRRLARLGLVDGDDAPQDENAATAATYRASSPHSRTTTWRRWHRAGGEGPGAARARRRPSRAPPRPWPRL